MNQPQFENRNAAEPTGIEPTCPTQPDPLAGWLDLPSAPSASSRAPAGRSVPAPRTPRVSFTSGAWRSQLPRVLAGISHFGRSALLEIEREIARQFQASGALLTASPCAAFQLALQSVGAGPGSEIVTTPIESCALQRAAESLGVRCRFADLDPLSLVPGTDAVDALVHSSTAALALGAQSPPKRGRRALRRVVPHIQIGDPQFLSTALAQRRSASALGVGSLTPSGQADESLGYLLFADEASCAEARWRRDHPLESEVLGEPPRAPDRFGARMAHGAVSALRVERAGRMLALRHYLDELLGIDGLRIAPPSPGLDAIESSLVVLTPESERDTIRAELERRGIATRQLGPIAATRSATGATLLPTTEGLARRAIRLPLHRGVRVEHAREVATALRRILHPARA